MRKQIVVFLAMLLPFLLFAQSQAVSGKQFAKTKLLSDERSVATKSPEEILRKIKTHKQQGTYDAALWEQYHSLFTPGRITNENLDEGGENCTTAIAISEPLPFDDTGYTTDNSDDYTLSTWGDECTHPANSAPDVVYSFTPMSDITVNVDLSGSAYDTKVWVYEGSCIGENVIACDDDSGTERTSRIQELFLNASVDYYIVVDGWDTESGFYILSITEYEEVNDISGPLSGVMGSDTFTVTGDISVSTGDTLILQPGTVFRFLDNVAFEMNGTLIAEGTVSDSIVFTASDPLNGWVGIFFRNGNIGSNLEYCRIEYSDAFVLAIFDGSPSFSHCMISDNYVEPVWIWDGPVSPEFTYCTITRNHSNLWSGGVSCSGNVDPVFSYCLITQNTSSYGGGIKLEWNSSATFYDCQIIDNEASEMGGGIAIEDNASVELNGCIFKGDSAGRGGAVYCASSGDQTFTNCIIDNNTSTLTGHGVYISSSNPSFINCTIVENYPSSNSLMQIYCQNSSAIILSSSIAFSDSRGIAFVGSCSGMQIEYCNIFGNALGNISNTENGPTGIGTISTSNANGDPCDQYFNIFLDPLFSDTLINDYHLSDASHCIGAGNPADPPSMDIEGNPRPDPPGSNPDLGAFENANAIPLFPPTVSTSLISDVTANTAIGGGEITSDGGAGITERGVCWNTEPNPETTDSHTSDGTGLGVFVSTITGLTPNSLYYVRAYATNSIGTSYGSEMSFVTFSNPSSFPPGSSWSNAYGGVSDDHGNSVAQTSDGGYILGGYTSSFGSGDSDFWLVKTDSNGDTVWSRSYGGNLAEKCYCVQQTDDGYILGGSTQSFGSTDRDYWIVKTNTNGDSLWSRTYGGSDTEECYSIEQATDGGFILGGRSVSYGSGSSDFWLVKIDANGDSLWSRTYGGNHTDWGRVAKQTVDGGYIIAGDTYTYGAGDYDFWVVKTSQFGDSIWSNHFGGIESDNCTNVLETSDGYLISGSTLSYGAGSNDFWIVKTNLQGDSLWSRTYGGSSDDICKSSLETIDGGYLLAGQTRSFETGDWDCWLVKVDLAGNGLWAKTIGGENADVCNAAVQSSDGGYILAGGTNSFGSGGYDFWLAKTERDCDLPLIEPDELVGWIDGDSLRLSWSTVPCAATYEVYWTDSPDTETWSLLMLTSSTTTADKVGLTEKRFYRVTAAR